MRGCGRGSGLGGRRVRPVDIRILIKSSQESHRRDAETQRRHFDLRFEIAKSGGVMSMTALLPMVADFISKPRKMLIGAEWKEASSGEWIETPDPATGKIIGRFPAGGAADVDAAVVAARK